ncbi:hypothetical protein K469DRAFT_710445 [Zopfia rhizophila CBS 207.26]|uniref:Uncharacterized protein n=1 Tax=Zopfia rhizophila CBS 207.26 TaxID=1314779 RepID=A0A6A6E166_9PEZI|nr:hypothetical protein K469DRAFT_710445 [Zopfia rhizophila CBS 207.26]
MDDPDHCDTYQNSCENDRKEGAIEPIAVIGLALKFPQDATSAESFWKLLLEKRSTVIDVPAERWNADAFYKPDGNKSGTTRVKRGNFISDDLACFDAGFFSISPAEAECMDPQQRWLLETSYHALENAGITLENTIGSNTSVHVGSFLRDYGVNIDRDIELPGKYKATGTGSTILANRLSWFYDFHGPSITIDTACSSSLIALHLACEGLRSGDANMALVCGCNLFYNPEIGVQLSDLNFLSPDGISYSFDQRANGYSRGEGFGVLVLKKLSEAIRDGDTIRSVIRSTGANQDGKTPGITQPSSQAQEGLIRHTYSRAGLDMSETRYFEAHGTGTAVGDPLEATAIARAFQGIRDKEEPIYVGALKSNIGHLEGASGIAGVIKTILVLESGIIPPNVWPKDLNPQIATRCPNLKFPGKATPWPSKGLRRASVNSFGFGGTNAHAVLDDAYHFLRQRNLEAPHPSKHTNIPHESEMNENNGVNGINGSGGINGDHSPRVNCIVEEYHPNRIEKRNIKILTLSTFDEAGISRATSALNRWSSYSSKEGIEMNITDLAYTLCNRRSNLPWRSTALISSVDDFATGLQWSPPVRAQKDPKLCFLFTGQGAQWWGMGYELMQFSTFKASMWQADGYFRALGSDWSLIDELFTKPKESSRLSEPACSQPICTALQIAILDLLKAWKVYPSVAVGHSSGEIAAAYCSGAIARESAWMVAYYRGLAVATTRESDEICGAMVSVQLGPEKVEKYLTEHNERHSNDPTTIACYNSPSNVTVSGSKSAIDRITAMLTEYGVIFRVLNVDVPYHSHHMDVVSTKYRELMHDIKPGEKPVAPVYFMSTSKSDGTPSSSALDTREYWATNLTAPVQFSTAMSTICEASRKTLGKKKIATADFIIEIGPHSTLRSPLKDVFQSFGRTLTTQYSSVLSRNQPGDTTALECAGKIHCIGYPIDLTTINQLRGQTPRLLTSLPYYPFNHETKFWLESRVSKQFRFREFPHHELLGTRASDWNELEARWNNRIILSEVPFLRDHKIGGVVLYSAASMLVMAIEAVRQLNTSDRKVKGYQFRDVTFHKAVPLSTSSQGTETQFLVRPARDNTSKQAFWNEFRLYVYEGEQWGECCRGAISVEWEDEEGSLPWRPRDFDNSEEVMQRFHRETQICHNGTDPKTAYEAFRESGMDYGPSFQAIQQLRWDNKDQAVATIGLHHWKSHLLNAYCEPHLIHPTTLDAIFQLSLIQLCVGGWKDKATHVPTRLQKLWLSAGLANAQPNDLLEAYTKKTQKTFRTISWSIIATQAEKPCLIGEMQMSKVENALPGTRSTHQKLNQRLFQVLWKPDLDLHRGKLPVEDDLQEEDPYTSLVQEREALCLAAIRRALKLLPSNFEPPVPYLQRYVDWMRHHKIRHGADNSHLLQISLQHPQELYETVENCGVEGKMLARVAQNISGILTGGVDPLGLLFSDDIMHQFYSEALSAPTIFSKSQKYIDALAHKNPGMRILEIGAGTGAATGYMLKSLANRYDEYVYTDISPGFFSKAEKIIGSQRVTFKTLDISKDPTLQGFQIGSFDMVVAANVIHATQDVGTALSYCRKLLKDGGRMILLECTNPEVMRIGFIFGLLPGWWSSTDPAREMSPLLTEREWDASLVQNGFSGVDVGVRAFEHDNEISAMQLMISTALELEERKPLPSKVTVVFDPQSDTQQQILDSLEIRAAELGQYEVARVLWSEVTDAEPFQSTCIFLPGVERGLLDVMDENALDRLKHVISSAENLMWITSRGPETTENPKEALVRGLARTIRSERENFLFATVTLENPVREGGAVKHISSILDNWSLGSSIPEDDYYEQDGVLHIGRVVEASDLAEEVFSDTSDNPTLTRSWGNVKGTIDLSISSVGLLDQLKFVESSEQLGELGAGEIEVQVMAVGLNFRDVLVALGQVSEEHFGSECSGVVTRVGPSSNLHVGDRVVGVIEGAMSNRCRCPAFQVQKIPDEMSFTEATSYTVAFCTAYFSLVNWARVRKGESVLIHSGAGGFGQAAIQLAKIFGCDIYVTVGSKEKAEFLSSAYGIPASHIFSSRNLDFAEGVRSLTKGRGVDVVLNSLSGEALRQSWDCVAPFGRFIEIGKKDIFAPAVGSMSGLPMLPFSRNVMFASVDLPQVASREDIFPDVLRSVMELAEQKRILPPQPLHVFKGGELEAAFRFMQTGKHTGKIVIEFSGNDVVHIEPLRKESRLFDSHSTYVIAGGLGGIGRSIAQWMVRKGARYLVLLSRQGPDGLTGPKKAFVEKLRAGGVRVLTPMCDIGDRQQLEAVLRDSLRDLPPIKGCVHSGMVLNDASFEHMTLENWQAALKPKLHGSWNLHELLPKGLDFFVMLASQTGIAGSHGQANYAAGNTYQDALAAHRVRHGEKAVSFDLGSITSVGYVAENPQLQARMRSRGVVSDFSEQDLLTLLEHYCSEHCPLPSPSMAQVITTMHLPSELQSRGIVEPLHLSRPFLNHLHAIDRWNHSESKELNGIQQPDVLLKRLASGEAANEVIAEAIQVQLSNLLAVDKESIEVSKPVHAYGADSLVAVEMRNWFQKRIGADVAVFEILANQSIAILAQKVAGKSKFIAKNSQ